MSVKIIATDDKLQALLNKFPDMDLEIWEMRNWVLKSWRDGRKSTLSQSFNLAEPEIFEHVSQYFPHIRNTHQDETKSNVINRLRNLETRYASRTAMLNDLGIDRVTYSRWITGQTEPKLQNLIDISRKACVSIDWLVGIA